MHAAARRVDLINRRDRQHHRKCRAFIVALTAGANASAVHLDEVANDRESESHTAMLPAGLLIRLPETIEHVRQEVRRNTLTSIADDYLEMRIYSL